MKKIITTPPKGTRDLFGNDFYRQKCAQNQILSVMEQYGFRQAQTPVFEDLNLLQTMAGPEITDQVYDFKDKSGRDLGIRSDITPAITRLFLSTSIATPKPIKISCADRVYRYERPQAGRYREINQVNGEMFGAQPPLADAEIISCFYNCYKAVGLPETIINIGFRPLLEGYLNVIKILNIPEAISIIDKKNKLNPIQFVAESKNLSNTSVQIKKIIEFISCQGLLLPALVKINRIISKFPNLQKYTDEMKQISQLLQSYGIYNNCRLNLGLARGSEYYTGIIFEAVNPNLIFSIGGGGRYDNLVTMFGGPPTPAIGFSIGLDRVCLIISQNKTKIISPQIDYYLISSPKTSSQKVIKLATKLRSQGKNVEINLVNRSPTEQIAIAKRLFCHQIHAVVNTPRGGV